MPATERSLVAATSADTAVHLSRESATDAARTTVADRPGPTPARCHSHDGIRFHAPAVGITRIPSGAGPGGSSPNFVTSRRQLRSASRLVTFCSRIEGTSAANGRPVLARRRPGIRCLVSRRSSCEPRSSSDQSSSAPSSTGTAASARSAPGPHAVALMVPPLRRCRVAGPFGVRSVSHTFEPSQRKLGSCGPRPIGPSVCRRSTRSRGA